MPGHTELQGFEFVAHLFVAVDGPHRLAGYDDLRDLWHRCRDEFGMADCVPGFHDRRDPPLEMPASAPWSGGVFAARQTTGPGKAQVVLRRLRDAFCLSFARAPAPGQGTEWSELDKEWTSVVGKPPVGVIGSVRILQARLTDEASVPDLDVGPAVAA